AGILFTLDTNRNKFLPTLKFRKFCEIAGFHHGVMTVTCCENDEVHMMTAQLPSGNFEKKAPATADAGAMEELLEKSRIMLLKLDRNEHQK
ncbi:hypothetical protein PENTCL1PPCAC_8389, partial [Pristionchus entomophagus]